MKAIVINGSCKAEDLRVSEIPVPKVRQGWVLVKIHAAGLNHSEALMRMYEADNDYINTPIVPGIECVGEVADASDSDLHVGDRVIALMGGMGRSFNGSYAEYALLPTKNVFKVDTDLDLSNKFSVKFMMTNPKYRHTYTVTASDITPEYRLTPNAMLMYFQDSFARLMTIHNVAAFDIVRQHRMWVITEAHIDVQSTATYWSEDITVELWVSELTSLRIYCDFRIIRADDEQLIASGTSQWNILNLNTKRLETTGFLADKLTIVPELMTSSHKKVRFPKPQSYDMQIEHRATRLDLDFNLHVSNRSYVTIALLTMPDEVLASQTLTSITVHWLHETYLDETLMCRMSRMDDESYLHLLTDSEGLVVCELMSKWQLKSEMPNVGEVLCRDL